MSSPYPLKSDELKWLRDCKLHQEQILYSRINIFVIGMSIAVTGIERYHSWDFGVALAVYILAILLTLIWLAAVHRQNVIVGDLRKQLDEEDWLYKKNREDRRLKDAADPSRNPIGFSGQTLVIYVLPLVFLLFWVFMLALHAGRAFGSLVR